MDTYANVTIETTMRKLAVAISLATRFVIILDNSVKLFSFSLNIDKYVILEKREPRERDSRCATASQMCA